MMDYMVTQIKKDRNNRENRARNCEAANLDRVIEASIEQCRAILKLQKGLKWDLLDEETKKLAELRLEFSYLSLSAVGEKMNPPMTKSSVNRRMKKLIELSEEK